MTQADHALKHCNKRIIEAHATINYYVRMKNDLMERYGTQRLGV